MARSKTALAKKTVKNGVRAVVHPKRSAHAVKHKMQKRSVNRGREKAYKKWFADYEKTISNIDEQREEIKTFAARPLISIIVPIYNTPEKYLKMCIESVQNQSYENWELCIADDRSTTDIADIIEGYAKKDKRIKLLRLRQNQHIAGASNAALKAAKGEFAALLDHDDLLTPNALYEVVKRLNEKPETDLVYTDEDKIEEGRGHIEPFFKPDWSPDFLLSCNYITHFSVMRRSILGKIGGFRLGTEGAQDWDLLLRFTGETNKIEHIAKVLYSWRKSPESTAKSSGSKPYAYINQLRVLRDEAQRKKLTTSVVHTKYMGFWHLKYHVQKEPLVSIIIPTKDNYELIKTCIESIIEKSTYPRFEIVIVDTGSKTKAVKDFYKSKLVKNSPVKIVNWDKPFNFSGACNLGAKESSGEYLLFLNNDTEVRTPGWIEEMLGLCQQPGVGMVGCKLLFPNKYIQHAGIVLSERDIAFHPFYGEDPELDIFTNIYRSNTRNCAAVTAACSMVSRKNFNKAGGFDEELRVTYNDVDLCLKLLKAGLRNVYTPYAELYHYESMSVGKVGTADRDNQELLEAQEIMRKRWADLLKRDPYYNDNFIQHGPGYQL